MKSIVVFYDPSFPYAGERPDAAQFDFGPDAVVVDASGLEQALASEQTEAFIHLHGPYFPKASWNTIVRFINRKGGFVNIGGAPLQYPVNRANGEWVVERRQTAYHQYLQIHEANPVNPQPIRHFTAYDAIPLLQGKESLFTVEPTHSLVLHVTRTKDVPTDDGSAGPMDAHLYPLLKGISKDDREVAAPAVLLENTKGKFAGSRWIFVNQTVGAAFWNGGGSALLTELANFSARGVAEMWLKPNFVTYEPGEIATLSLHLQSLKLGTVRNGQWTFRLRIAKEGSDRVLFETEFAMEGSPLLRHHRIKLPFAMEAGYYGIECTATADSGETRVLRQGIWGRDEALLQSGEPLSAGRDYFVKNGKPFPIVGMTYMASDVARKYLLLPNVSVWDRDMAQMKKAGINFIRTGLWTAFKSVMFMDGHPYEEVLRAIDAFILTAKKNDLEVTFNFFAFTPELWEGVNPYLDPRSVEAQKRLITSVVERHVNTTNVQWDLINEPSMNDPKRLWVPNAAQDHFEQAAFSAWLKERHGNIETLRERWNMTAQELPGFEGIRAPERSEINFGTTPIQPRRSAKWLDFVLFTQDVHNGWASNLTKAIKDVQPQQLVTVGQDEALAMQRPSPFFYAEAVDYTTCHSWWMMDYLVWDGIFTKTPYKPNMIQETGIMYIETPDGRAKRSEEELRNILERKYAYTFSTGGAGAVQWIWNINYHMDNVNESNIGALRADGTEKPEADVSYDFGRFMAQIGDLFADRKLEEVVAIFPYSNDFSNRAMAVDGTQKLARTLAYDMNVPFRAMGEYHLQALADQTAPKLIIVPSAHNFSDEAFDALLAHIRDNGGTLLFTGPISLDTYWQPKTRLSAEFGEREIGNVLREELLSVNGRHVPVSFGGARIAQVCKEYAAGGGQGAVELREAAIGKGTLLWSPLPVELNDRTSALTELYGYALSRAGVQAELEWNVGGDLAGIYGRKLTFAQGALFIFVSEYAVDSEIEVTDPANGKSYKFTVEKERTVMFATDAAGSVTAVYRPEEVQVAVK